jgi:hypothetical protein
MWKDVPSRRLVIIRGVPKALSGERVDRAIAGARPSVTRDSEKIPLT